MHIKFIAERLAHMTLCKSKICMNVNSAVLVQITKLIKPSPKFPTMVYPGKDIWNLKSLVLGTKCLKTQYVDGTRSQINTA